MGGQGVFEICFEVLSQNSSKGAIENCEYIIRYDIRLGFSWFPCVYKQMLRWFPKFQVATTCFSYSPPDLNLLVTNFMFCIHVK